MYNIVFKKTAQKYFDKLPRDYRGLLIWILWILATGNWEKIDVEVFVGIANMYRVRFWKYRCIFELKESELIIEIIKIWPRGDVYK